MSIDPLELIDRYGADALRFAICALTGPGRDVKLGAVKGEGLSGFRHQVVERGAVLRNERHTGVPGFDPGSVRSPLCRWILDAANAAVTEATAALEDYRLDEYAAERLSFRLEHVLRLVPGVCQAGVR